ncbi:L-2-amino-thiazoline-4-carboxylic acid hydrolase [Telmatospirillum sp.]|uniref:L-2-amino-thiazoline-4-carboxylic acid hydrolase n=1 Tax=Telmatospirillum sp. TaxID=2079197 RepID=UPI0028480327|nr:L-2-amino-thiazoline-4-carboxylic acid hydrolase [Telmatospirillum sp.]MDR3435420.1 L-2-amino-thiazoline-4-carboxylic acid hydrolase [Telmatospirillum sp.]
MVASILEQRRIEAAFAKQIFDAMEAEIGREAAGRILGKAVVAAARTAGADLAASTGGPSDLLAFAQLLKLWQQEDALVIDWLRVEADHLDFNVTRCRYAEAYRALGVADIGGLLSCSRDGEFCAGYDPRMKLTRTQTIMEGADHCDFRYALPEGRS